jgi:glutamyl-tRNA synthetase
MNGHYIREASDARIGELLSEALFAEGVPADFDTVAAAVPLVKERMRTVVEGASMIRFLFVERLEPDERARGMLGPERSDYLKEAASRLAGVEEWTAEQIHEVLQGLREAWKLSSKEAFQPIRAAVTGTLVSPPLFESMALLGRERSLGRIRQAAGVDG